MHLFVFNTHAISHLSDFFFHELTTKNMANKNWKQKTRLNAFNHHLLYTVCLFCMCVVWNHNTNKRVKKNKQTTQLMTNFKETTTKGKQTNAFSIDKIVSVAHFFLTLSDWVNKQGLYQQIQHNVFSWPFGFFLLQSHQIATLNDFQKMKTQIISVYIETVNSWIWTRVRRSLFLVYQPRSNIIKKANKQEKPVKLFPKTLNNFFLCLNKNGKNYKKKLSDFYLLFCVYVVYINLSENLSLKLFSIP